MTTVEPSLTATPLQEQLFFCPGGQSIHSRKLFELLFNGHLSTTATVTKTRPVNQWLTNGLYKTPYFILFYW